MGLVDIALDVLKELKNSGIARVPLKKVVEEIVARTGCRRGSAYNAIKELELLGKVRITGNRRNKIVEILL